MARGFQSMASFTCGVVLLSLVTQAASAGFAFYSRPQPFASVPFGDNVIFNCTTNGTNITTTLKKEFSGKFVSLPHPSVNIKFVRKGDVFTVIDFGIPDSGGYKCYASDVNGNSIEYSTFLIPNMNKLPKMHINPHYLVTKTEGESTNFTCESASKTTLTWYKMVGQSDIPVPADKIATINAVTKKQVILMIKNAQISDSGDYKCILTFANKEKYEMTSLKILKIIPAQIISASPKVVTGVRQEVLLSCILKAYPRPTIRWFKGDKEIKANLCDLDEKLPAQCGPPDMQYRSELKTLVKYEKYNATLIITKTSYPSDQGMYHCKAGEKDKIVSADVYVDIQVKPSINKKTSTKMVSSNVPAKVSCSVADTNPTPTWSWEFQKRVCIKGADSCNPSDSSWQSLPKNHQVVPSLKTPTNTSLINIPKEQKDAFYRCIATNILSSDNFTKIFLRNDNIDSIKIKDSKVPQVYTAGVDTIRIECDVLKQFSPIGVLWYKDGKLISPLDDNRISIEKTNASLDESYIRHVFTISNTTANDTGTYMCKLVMDINKKDSIQVTVIARVAPNITGLVSQHVKMEVTQFVELRCDTLDANPQATITWYFRKSKDSKENNKIMGISTDLDNTKGCQSRRSGYYFLRDQKGAPLIICNPKHPKHTGWYQCVAENIEGSDRKDANVNVLAAASIIQAPTNRVIKTTLGTPLNITCVASGNPVPDVIWTKSGNRKVLVMGKGMARLQFVELLEKNLGNYTCNATNYKSSVLVFSISETSNDIMAQTNKAISQQALIGIICGCIAFVLIVSIICLAVYRRQKKQIEEYKELYFLRTGNSDYKIDPDRSLLDQCNDLPYDLDWEFPEERLILGKPLGAGAFGQVVRAEAIGMPAFKPRDKTPDAVKNRSKLRRSMRESKKKNEYSSMRLSKTTVAVKTLKEGASQSDYKDLASELKILIHLGNQKNIVNILGACTRGRRLMVIIEFAPHGDLLSFLRGKRDIYEPNWVKTSNNPEQEFTLVDLGMAAYQISRGMEFLASRKCVHRDLAARNVLVGHDYVMKISDFGLARDIYQDDLYVKTTSGLLPVKWMAMESLFDRVYTEKSDVWSFGIVLWETFTLGGNPYPGLPTEQLLDYLSEGQRMKQPQNCPLEMYAIMRDCWMQFPDQRPEFVAIAERLGKILEKNVSEDNPYIHLEMDEQTGQTDYYLNPCDAFNTQGRQTVDGYEEALPTPRPDTSNKYDTPLPTLPPPDSPGYDGPSEPLPSIPPTYEQATMGFQRDNHRNQSQSSNESGIGIDEKEKDRGEREPLMVHLEDETKFSPDKKGKSRANESTV